MNPFFKDCIKGDNKLTLIIRCNCFKSKKLVFNINTEDPKELDQIMEEIKNVIQRYDISKHLPKDQD
jgi:hypothetical protein